MEGSVSQDFDKGARKMAKSYPFIDIKLKLRPKTKI